MRPRTRGDCVDRPRPCPWASCRWHAAHEQRHLADVEDLAEGASCALDIADGGEALLSDVGAHFGVVRERARQIEEKALASLKTPRRLRMLQGAL